MESRGLYPRSFETNPFIEEEFDSFGGSLSAMSLAVVGVRPMDVGMAVEVGREGISPFRRLRKDRMYVLMPSNCSWPADLRSQNSTGNLLTSLICGI